MIQEFTIEGRLPGMNEIIGANRSNRHAGARQKAEAQGRVVSAIETAGLAPMRTPVVVHIDWYEEVRRRDPDNIYAGAKFIMDALQVAGIIENDSFYHVLAIANRRYAANKGCGRIRVRLEEA